MIFIDKKIYSKAGKSFTKYKSSTNAKKKILNKKYDITEKLNTFLISRKKKKNKSHFDYQKGHDFEKEILE